MQLRVKIDSFGYAAERPVLRGVELTIGAGETTAILGASGCGKSTLLRVLSGILPSNPKHRFIGSVDLFGQSPHAYRTSGRLAYMFQEPTLFPNRTVRDNVALPLELMGIRNGGLVDEMLSVVGLHEFDDYLPRQLSGGMRTRVALARSFVTKPELLLLDEPFAALDLTWKRDLYSSLSNLKGRFGTTTVMVTHDLQEAVFSANRILVIARNGSPLDVLAIDRPLPRPFDFSHTVSELTSELDYLAQLITTDTIRRTTTQTDAIKVLEPAEERS